MASQKIGIMTPYDSRYDRCDLMPPWKIERHDCLTSASDIGRLPGTKPDGMSFLSIFRQLWWFTVNFDIQLNVLWELLRPGVLQIGSGVRVTSHTVASDETSLYSRISFIVLVGLRKRPTNIPYLAFTVESQSQDTIDKHLALTHMYLAASKEHM